MTDQVFEDFRVFGGSVGSDVLVRGEVDGRHVAGLVRLARRRQVQDDR